jgi:hypothetical protein
MVLGFTIARGKIVEIDAIADPARLRQLDLAILDDRSARSRSGVRRRGEAGKGGRRA